MIVPLLSESLLLTHENTELIPSVEYYDLYPTNYEPTEHIKLVIFGVPVINKPDWVEVA